MGAGVAAAVAIVAAVELGRRWRAGGHPDAASLAWTVALALWAVAAAVVAAGVLGGHTGPTVRIHLLAGTVLAPAWAVAGLVARHAADRLTLRIAGAVVGLGVLTQFAALSGDRTAIATVVFTVAWAVVLLDGHRQRAVVLSFGLVAAWSALAVVTVLPAPLTGALPAAGLPLPADVLGDHVVGLGTAVTVVVPRLAAALLVVSWAHGLLAHRPSDNAGWLPFDVAWRAWDDHGSRGGWAGAAVVAIGTMVGSLGHHVAVLTGRAIVVAGVLTIAVVLVNRGARPSATLRAPVRHDPSAGPTTRVWD